MIEPDQQDLRALVSRQKRDRFCMRVVRGEIGRRGKCQGSLSRDLNDRHKPSVNHTRPVKGQFHGLQMSIRHHPL
jgi:hypothetical protein